MAYGSFDLFCSELSPLLDGGLAGAEAKNEILPLGTFEMHSREIVGSAKLCWVVDLWREIYVDPSSLPVLDFVLRWANAVQASLIDWLKGGRSRRLLYYSLWRAWKGDRWRVLSEEDSSKASIPSYAVVVSALVLLCLGYQYLTGTVDLGSSKAYSRSSLDFRDIYVATVLFLGAYVWIKFREVAPRGVHKRTRVDKQGRTKVFYDARLTPPKWNGEAVPKLELGQFATEQEAHNKFLIAAFYYNRDAGLLDGWFQVPPMSEEGRSRTGLRLREWVIGQAKKVYEDFRREEATLLLQELLEDEVTPEQDEVNVNLGEQQERALVSQEENLVMDMTMPNDHGWECASQSFGRMHEGFVNSAGQSLGFEEESAIPIPHLSQDTQSGMGINNSNQLNLLQVVHNQQLITYLQQLQELGAQNFVLQDQERIQQQQLDESRVHISQLESQHFVQQQLQVINEGVPSLDVEMEPSMPHPNHPCSPRDSAFW